MLPEKSAYVLKSNVTASEYSELENSGILCGQIPVNDDILIRINCVDVAKIPPAIRDYLIAEIYVIGKQ